MCLKTDRNGTGVCGSATCACRLWLITRPFSTIRLVKRCLYLFAGLPDENGQVAANLFTAPAYIADDTYFFDYSLLFVTTLHDYYFAAEDLGTLVELWPTAYRQIEIALDRLDGRGLVKDDDSWYSFIDWHEKLNKQAASQGVLIYAMKQALKLAEVMESDKGSLLTKTAARNFICRNCSFME